MSNLLAFVTSEFRYVQVDNPSVRAQYTSTAQEIVIDTNLDEAGAIRRANEELAAGGTTRVFEITVQQLYLPDDFVEAPPRFALYSKADNLDGDVFTAFEVAGVDFTHGTSTLRVR
jgi:hypothetical protein